MQPVAGPSGGMARPAYEARFRKELLIRGPVGVLSSGHSG